MLLYLGARTQITFSDPTTIISNGGSRIILSARGGGGGGGETCFKWLILSWPPPSPLEKKEKKGHPFRGLGNKNKN